MSDKGPPEYDPQRDEKPERFTASPTTISTFVGADFGGFSVTCADGASSTSTGANKGSELSGRINCPRRRRRRQS